MVQEGASGPGIMGVVLRLICCFCGGDTSIASDADYVEISVRFPAATDSMVQWFGAHAGCLQAVTAPGIRVEGWSARATFGVEPNPQVMAVPPYDRAHGVMAPVEGGNVDAGLSGEELFLSSDPAGLRDLARWLLALSHAEAPPWSHVHLDPGVIPLSATSKPLLLARAEPPDATSSP